MSCKNCGNQNIGNYCSKCGQKRVEERLSIKEIKSDIINNLFNYESNLFKTVFRLTTKPKITITNFLIGKRKSYFNPFKLLFIVLTIKTLLDNKLSKNVDSTVLAQNIYLNEYWKLIMMIFYLPIFSYFSYKFFKKYKYNFTEHLIINTYFLSVVNIFVIITYLSEFIFTLNFNVGMIAIIIQLIVLVWLYANLYSTNLLSTIIKTILISIIGFTILISLLLILSKIFQ